MPISRRIFIKAASIAAIAVATVGKSTLEALAQGGATDPLSYYTQATFTQYVNSIFRLHGFRTVEVMLEKVQDTLPATVTRTGGRESFMLHFRGGDVHFPQGTYT
ncbi:MAG: twin-arginine translocation signal domain-containing protein, partial [Pyrinomonadaceae bacterium]